MKIVVHGATGMVGVRNHRPDIILAKELSEKSRSDIDLWTG